MLARAFATSSNLVVLDEPASDLDLETLDVLQDRLGDYGGTALLVSPDQDFDRIVNAVIRHGRGAWTEYAGGYTDMLAQRGAGFVPTTGGRPAFLKLVEARVEPAAPKPRSRRLSFNEAHAPAILPATISRG